MRKKDGSYQPVVAHSSVLPYQGRPITVSIIRPEGGTRDEELPIVNEAGIKNEVNTALTIIQGYIELIEAHENVAASPELSKWFDIITQNLTRIERTTK